MVIDSVKTTALPLPRPSAAEIENDPDGILKRPRLGVVRQRAGARDEALDASQLARRTAVRSAGPAAPRWLRRSLVVLLEIAQHLERIVGGRLGRRSRRRSRAATFSRLAASAAIDDAMRR